MPLGFAQFTTVQMWQRRVDCISHLLPRCRAILIPSSETLKVRSDEDIHGFPCSAGEETPSHLSHMRFPIQWPQVPAVSVLSLLTVKGCCSAEVVELYVPGTLKRLLSNSAHVINCSSFDSFAPTSCGQGLSEEKQPQNMLSPAEKSQGETLLLLCLHLSLLLFGKNISRERQSDEKLNCCT